MEISKRINLKIGILKNYLKIKVWKIKFEIWSFKNYLKEIGVLKMKFGILEFLEN